MDMMQRKKSIIMSQPHVETSTGSVAIFNTDMRANMPSLKVEFSPIQEGSGDPSPSNIRNISGWTGCTVEHTSKNIAHIVGYSAVSENSTDVSTFDLTNNYGTTIDKAVYSPNDRNLVITQSNASTDYAINSYRNGYLTIMVDNLKFGERYDVSFKIKNVISNPLNATPLNDFVLYNPSGSTGGGGGYSRVISGDTIIFKKWKYDRSSSYPTRRGIDIRICGMSFTLADFMITLADESDSVYEDYSGTTIPVTFPATKNLFDEKYTGIVSQLTYHSLYVGEGVVTASTTTPRSTPDNYSNIFVFPGQVTSGAGTGINDICLGTTRTVTPIDGYITIAYRNGYGVDPTLYHTQIEKGSSATSYEPYGTVYGGYVDVAKETLVVEYGSYTFTGSQADDIAYLKEGTLEGKTRHQFTTKVLDNIAKKASTAYAYSNIASPNHWTLPRTNDLLFYIGTPTNQVSLYILSTECDATVESFNAWLALHPWTIVYQLENPVEYTLTTSQLKSIIGQNNIWANTNGNTTVMYWKH